MLPSQRRRNKDRGHAGEHRELESAIKGLGDLKLLYDGGDRPSEPEPTTLAAGTPIANFEGSLLEPIGHPRSSRPTNRRGTDEPGRGPSAPNERCDAPGCCKDGLRAEELVAWAGAERPPATRTNYATHPMRMVNVTGDKAVIREDDMIKRLRETGYEVTKR